MKVSNLINMYRSAKHDVVVISDSDTEVARDCLGALVAPLGDVSVGAVTCLYKGVPAGGFASTLGALFINDWFLASAVVDAGMRDVAYCFGPVTAVRRDALEASGGLGALSSHLADDFMLGRMITAAGYKVRLSRYVADIVVAENCGSLLRHELRWARTVRTVKPGEHFLSAVMEPLPLLLLLLLPYPQLGGWMILGAVLCLRIVLHYLVRWRFAITGPGAPGFCRRVSVSALRSGLRASAASHVSWRHRDFTIAAGGRLEPCGIECRGSECRPLKRLIVTADDFGLTPGVNEAVEEGHRRGILTAASLMVTGEAAEDAVRRAKRMPRLGVGLHLVLVDGTPMLSADRIPELVGPDGRFSADIFAIGVRIFCHRAARRQVAAEIRAQLEAFRRTGLALDHVNAHHHFHLHPTVQKELLRLAPRIRHSSDSGAVGAALCGAAPGPLAPQPARRGLD